MSQPPRNFGYPQDMNAPRPPPKRENSQPHLQFAQPLQPVQQRPMMMQAPPQNFPVQTQQQMQQIQQQQMHPQVQYYAPYQHPNPHAPVRSSSQGSSSQSVGTFVPPGPYHQPFNRPAGPVYYAPIPPATSLPSSVPENFSAQNQYIPYNPRMPPTISSPPPQNAYSQPYPSSQGHSNASKPWSDSGSDSSQIHPHPAEPIVQQSLPKTPSVKSPFASLKRSLSRKEKSYPNIPKRSYALDDTSSERTNKGNTRAVMALLADMWFVHTIVIFALVYLQTFVLAWGYDDVDLWNISCYYKLGWLLPTPYTLICLFGLIMPYRTPRFLYHDKLTKRRCDNLYILTVTRGNNREAVYRSWNAHRHLERIHPSVRVHVLTDEPFFFENINCYTCPKQFSTAKSKYKARALEWYRQTMAYTEFDWVLHLDEESVIDDESVRRVLEFIWYETDMHMGQGPILYNQYQYFKNWVFTVADALRVGDDLSRFHLQLSFFKRPIWGCHGSFLLVNGLVENAITWDLGSLTEDYEFAMASWARGFKVGKVPGFIREQSPQGMLDFMKQRRRWFVGIWRLKHPLPKIWAFFWTLGSLCLFTTLASIPLGFVIKLGVPRWFGLVKDVTSSTFMYLYLLGIFVQDLDKGKNPFLVLIHIPLTFVVSFIAVILETLSVLYGIMFPPKDFDVIKK